jgi:hypothetical protein
LRNGSDASGDLEHDRLQNAFFYKGIPMLTSLSFLTEDQKPKPEIIPYSKEAMRQDLERVRDAWGDCQSCRQRDAIYGYLTAVYDLVIWWAAEQRDVERAHRALCSRRLDVRAREDPFAAIIRCTADPDRVDERTRSKWSRVMRYATAIKDQDEPFKRFVVRKGGINKCASRYTRLLRRQAKASAAKRRKQLSGGEPSGKTRN